MLGGNVDIAILNSDIQNYLLISEEYLSFRLGGVPALRAFCLILYTTSHPDINTLHIQM